MFFQILKGAPLGNQNAKGPHTFHVGANVHGGGILDWQSGSGGADHPSLMEQYKNAVRYGYTQMAKLLKDKIESHVKAGLLVTKAMLGVGKLKLSSKDKQFLVESEYGGKLTAEELKQLNLGV